MTQPQPITTEQQLRAAISRPENEHLEFKEAQRSFNDDKLLEYCVALANECGGNLVLGVTDKQPRQIVDTNCFSSLDKIKRKILNELRFRVDIYEILVSEKRVLTFFCPPQPPGTPQQYRGRYLMLPQAEVIFEYRNSDSVIEYQDRVEYRAGFFLWHNEIWKKINARNETRSYRDSMFRYDIPAFNESVIREALLNAITHREYRGDSRSIFVRQFPNRLEVVSPGGFPSGITADNITYRQDPRNRLIAEALQHCGLVERSGQGADRMFRTCIMESKKRPDYTGSDDNQVSLVLDGQLRDPHFVKYLNRLAKKVNMGLVLEHFLVLDRVREGEPIPEDLNTRFLALVDKGAIEKVGRGLGVRYILSRALYEHMSQAGTYARREALDEERNQELALQHIRDSGSKAIGELEQVLPNKTRPQIRALLRRLKASGHIRIEGRTRGARWHLAETGNDL